jgi:hypothetical protein
MDEVISRIQTFQKELSLLLEMVGIKTIGKLEFPSSNFR